MYKHKIEVEVEYTIGDMVIVTHPLGSLSRYRIGEVGKILGVRAGVANSDMVCYMIEYDNGERRLVPIFFVSKATETVDNPYQK